LEYAKRIENEGAGEILINSIDRDGVMGGYDIELIKSVSNSIKIPVIACGGAGSLNDFRLAVKEGGASAVAAGSFFVFHGKRRAVLITYPSYSEISDLFN
jgi:cyclase